MRLASDPLALAKALPDVPRWVETRDLLSSGEAALTVTADATAGVVVDRRLPSGAVVGRADEALLRRVLADAAEDFELIVQLDVLAEAKQALPGWKSVLAVVHFPARPFAGGETPGAGVVISAPPEGRWLEQLPYEIGRFAASAQAIAVRVVEGSVVAVCATSAVTETLWDVGVDTFEGHRRRGHAEACFRALAAHMASRGRQPVWAADEGNRASLELASKLGFQPVDRVAVLTRAG